MEYAAYFLLLVAIPFCAFKVTQSPFVGWLIACFSGCPILIARMIYLESKAVDSDFDLIFLIGIVLWCGILNFLYGVCAIVVGFFRSKRSGSSETQKETH
jgi:hypothetical protein